MCVTFLNASYLNPYVFVVDDDDVDELELNAFLVELIGGVLKSKFC